MPLCAPDALTGWPPAEAGAGTASGAGAGLTDCTTPVPAR